MMNNNVSVSSLVIMAGASTNTTSQTSSSIDHHNSGIISNDDDSSSHLLLEILEIIRMTVFYNPLKDGVMIVCVNLKKKSVDHAKFTLFNLVNA